MQFSKTQVFIALLPQSPFDIFFHNVSQQEKAKEIKGE